MDSETRPRQAGNLSRQLARRVTLLSLIAILGLVILVAVGLLSSLQGTQRQLSGTGATATGTIDDFLSSINDDMLATSDALALTQDKDEVLRRALNRQPRIFELIVVDPQGQVLAQRRRVGQAKPTVTAQPWLATVEIGTVYIGPVDYVEFGVPFVNIATGINDAEGYFSATLLAKVDLTALWEDIIRLEVGRTGYLYITDEKGQLLAYRNLELIREGITLEGRIERTPKEIAEGGIEPYVGLAGETVVGVGLPLRAAPWFVIVEQPVTEALRLFAWLSAILLTMLLIVGLLVYSFVVFTQQRIASPLVLLREGVELLRQGELGHRIEIQTKDEFGDLAAAFNTMATQLQGMIGTLEQRVAARTRGLQTAAEVSRTTTSVLDPDQLLRQVVDLVRERFDLYYVGLFLLDEDRQFAVLRAGTGEAGQQMIARGHRLEAGGDSMIGQCVARDEARIALDVGEEATRFDNPFLPETRSEMALPLRSRGRVIGAMTVQSVEEVAFTEADIAVMQTMADQVAVAIDNARLFAETQASLEAMRRAYIEVSRQAWAEALRARPEWGYRYAQHAVAPTEGDWRPEMARAARTNRIVQAGGTGEPALAIPLKIRDNVVGVLDFRKGDSGEKWTAEEVTLLEALVDQLGVALESARLYQDAQRRAIHERLVGEISERMQRAADMETLMRITAEELNRMLGGSRVYVRMSTEQAPSSPDGDGQAGTGDD